MNLDLYKVFYQVAKSGSITKAADKLFLTQPTVSYLIKQLEGELGVSLFTRKSKGVLLTKEGSVLFRHVEESLLQLQIGQNKIAQLKSLTSGEVKIGVSETLCKYLLMPTIESFHQEYPDIKIRLTHGKSFRIVKHLYDGEIDFGIVPLPVENKNITIKEVFSIQDCFVTGQKYKKLTQSNIPLKELSQYPTITLSENSNTRNFLISLLENNGLTIQPDIELGSIELLKEFTRIGFGISLISKQYVEEELKEKSLYEIKVNEGIPPRKIGVITLDNASLSIASKQFMEELNK